MDEHRLKIAAFFPDLEDRCAARQGLINRFYANPETRLLERMAARWNLTHVVLQSDAANNIRPSLALVVFRTSEWSVLEIRPAKLGHEH